MKKILSLSPAQKFLFISGYSESQLKIEGYSGPIELVNKPFNPSDLLEKIREILDRVEHPAEIGV
jgi:DNA-binding response OmpR family regulator